MFSISSHTALKLGIQALRSCFKVNFEYELHTLPNTKVSATKDHGKNYGKVRPPLFRHLLHNRLLSTFVTQRCILIHLALDALHRFKQHCPS